MPAFLVPCAGAYRLARFNIDTQQSNGFKGVPIPAVGLLFAAFPLIFWYNNQATWIINLLTNHWFWYAIIIAISYLMISTLPMLAMKFKHATLKSFLPFIIMAISAMLAALFFNWLAVPITFVVYVIISLFYKTPTT